MIEHTSYQRYLDEAGLPHFQSLSAADCADPLPQTIPNITGPFYRADAPFLDLLADESEPGRRLTVSGQVTDECLNALDEAILDVWQAASDGHYDNDDPENPPPEGEFRLRGQIVTDGDGRYAFHTIWPGAYSVGNGVFRPSHIHVKVRAAGFLDLTTQLYFAGDPHNEHDGFGYHPSLELNPELVDGIYVATFNFVLARG